MKYEVFFEPFTERHYIRTFARKYKNAWNLTLSLLQEEFEQIDILFLKSIAEYITDKKADIVICKTEFKIAGTQESRHGSGNRCIVAIHRNVQKVCVLLIYGKTDLSGSKETTKWKNLVKNNYPEYCHLF
jgi:hypothetical protein